MPQPQEYSPTTGFQQEETNQVAGRSTVRTPALDVELANLATSINPLVANIGMIQRDDGELKDGIVKVNSLSAAVLVLLGSAGFTISNPLGWLTATVYAARVIVTNGTGTYVCAVAHTSGVFATDLAAGKWVTLFDSVTYAAGAVTFTPTGGISATNVQSMGAELDSEKARKDANLGDLTNVATARSNLSVPSKAEIQNSTFNSCVAGGTVDAITGAFTPAVTALTNNMLLVVECGGANVSTTPTFKADGTAAKTIVRPGGTALRPGDISSANYRAFFCYDASLDVWMLLNPPPFHEIASIGSVVSRSSNITLGHSDSGKTIRATSSFTQTFDAAATLGDGWWVLYINEGTGNTVLDPNGAETIAGQTTWQLRPGESVIIVGNATNLQILAYSRYAGAIGAGRNIAARTDATTPNSKVNVTADELQLKDANGNVFVALAVSLTAIDITTSGANGLDTGAEAANTWYYVWVIAKSDGTVAGLLSTSSSAPTMPTGYIFKALASAVRNDGSSNFIKYRQVGNEVFWEAGHEVLAAGAATTETSVSVASFVPPIAQTFCIAIRKSGCVPDGGSIVVISLLLRVVTGVNFLDFLNAVHVPSSTFFKISGPAVWMPNLSQNVFYLHSITNGSAPESSLDVIAFKLPLGGE